MFRLVETQASNPWIQHKTWTRLGETEFRLSPLQNQFALAEIEPPLSTDEASAFYRRWLWDEMQNEQNVVWREMSELVNACEQGKEVEVMVPKCSTHGEVLIRALDWMAHQTREIEIPRITSTEPSPCHEPILPDGTLTTPADIDPKHLVWIHGNQQSRIGVISEFSVAFVPEFGVAPLIPGRFHWVDRQLANQPQFQATLSQALDEAFEKEADQSAPEYEAAPEYLYGEPFEEDWGVIQEKEEQQQSNLLQAGFDDLSPTLADDLLQETEDVASVVAIAQLPEEPMYHRRPPQMLVGVQEEYIRPVYLHQGGNSPLRIKNAEEQMERGEWRYATREEAEQYRIAFHSQSE